MFNLFIKFVNVKAPEFIKLLIMKKQSKYYGKELYTLMLRILMKLELYLNQMETSKITNTKV